MLNLDDITATRILLGGRPTWLYSDGTMLPIISGGDGSDDDTGDGDGDEGDDDTGDGDDGAGDQGDGGSDTDPAAEAAKWKALARKHEDRAKANAAAAKELEKLRAATMSDTEKAVAEAEQRGRTAATAEHAQALAGARIEAALTGVVPDPGAFVEDLNLSKYVTDTGDVDTEAITALRDKYAALAGPQENGSDKGPRADLKQGNRGKSGGGKPQLKRTDLEGMSPDAVEQARLDGRLNDILGIKPT